MYVLKIVKQSALIGIGLVALACLMIYLFGKDVGEALYFS